MITQEQAQASLEREREAYWARRNAPPPPVEFPGPVDLNRAQRRASGQRAGVTRSQRARPARPTAGQIRAQRELDELAQWQAQQQLAAQ